MAQKRVRKCTIFKQQSNDNWKWYRKTDNGNELSDIEFLRRIQLDDETS